MDKNLKSLKDLFDRKRYLDETRKQLSESLKENSEEMKQWNKEVIKLTNNKTPNLDLNDMMDWVFHKIEEG